MGLRKKTMFIDSALHQDRHRKQSLGNMKSQPDVPPPMAHAFSEEPLCISAVCRTPLWSSTVKGVLLLRLNVGPIRNYWRCIVTGQCSTRQPEHDQP
ncbi:hypothetical protein UPYG_G00144000 [Umbra pygmaea]|uniref:Uncharacterized protein n=1 Tax=Umbra pygmaea TaxID=75934 RepID=A0ABD0X0A8_UMBPY